MVIRDQDIVSGDPVEASTSKALGLASPMDRLGAFVIDHFIILGPIAGLLLSPFERRIKEAILVGDEASMLVAILSAVTLVLSCLTIYHTVFLVMVGGSLGQVFMGLRVVSTHSSKPLRPWAAFLRVVLWTANFFLLGLPLLAVFSDQRRRPWYDRATDAVVLTNRNRRAVNEPTVFHRSVVQGFLAAMSVAGVSLVGTMLISEIQTFDRKTKIYSLLEEDEVLCAAVGQAIDEWPDERGQRPTRVSVALAMYFANEIDVSCLESEFDERAFANQDNDLARLAKSFIYQDHQELSDLYLKGTCQATQDGDPCRLAQAILGQKVLIGDAGSGRFSQAPLYIKLWGLSDLLRSGAFNQAAVLLSSIPGMPWLSGFRAVAQTKLMWGQGEQEKSKGSFEGIYDLLSEQSQSELSAWMCLESFYPINGSDGTLLDFTEPCRRLEEVVARDPGLAQNLTVSLAMMKLAQQKEGGALQSFLFTQKDLHPEVNEQAWDVVKQRSDRLRARAQDQTIHPSLRREAIYWFFSNADPDADIQWIEDVLVKGDLPLVEKFVFSELSSIYYQAGDDLGVGRLHQKAQSLRFSLGQQFLQRAVISAYRLGKLDLARANLKLYGDLFAKDQDRTPASLEPTDEEDLAREFSKVAGSL